MFNTGETIGERIVKQMIAMQLQRVSSVSQKPSNSYDGIRRQEFICNINCKYDCKTNCPLKK